MPKRDLWINRLYFDISNSGTKQCLTIEARDINDLEPAKFRTQADSNKEQICYYIGTKETIILILSWQRENKHRLLLK